MSLITLAFPNRLKLDRLTKISEPAKSTQAQHFEAIFTRYQQPITSYLYRLTGDEGMASDLSQETFIQAWQHLDQLRDPQAVRAWLYRIATNTATRYVQRQKAQQLTELPVDWPGMSDPGRRIAEQESVQRILLTLTLKQRSALILHEVHHFSCAEIGDMLHLSRDAVKMALWRGREQFRVQYLQEEDV